MIAANLSGARRGRNGAAHDACDALGACDTHYAIHDTRRVTKLACLVGVHHHARERSALARSVALHAFRACRLGSIRICLSVRHFGVLGGSICRCVRVHHLHVLGNRALWQFTRFEHAAWGASAAA
jgi:hypothetical protein